MAKKKPSTEDINQVLSYQLFNNLRGRNFCQTGTMSVSRSQLEMIITSLGGYAHDTVKSTTDYLIIPNGNDFKMGSKYNAAVKADCMIITEEDFCKMFLPSIDELYGERNASGASK